jgi:phosphoserine phosphatase
VTQRRPPAFASVVLDVDSTVSGVEGIDWLAARRGPTVASRIAALTDRVMRGDLPLEAVYGARLAEIRPSRADVEALSGVYVEKIAPDCQRAVAALRRAGVRVVLVSGGIRNAMVALAEQLGVDGSEINAVDVRFDSAGDYAGYDERSPLATATGKRIVIEALALPRPSVMVGDGATDLAARGAVDQFAAFTGFVARAPVVRVADIVLKSFAELQMMVLEGE